MALPRGSSLVGQDADIGIKFSRAGVPFDPFDIPKVVITNPSAAQLEITTITQTSAGNFRVIVPSSFISEPGLYLDTWFFQVTATDLVQSVVQDFFVDSALADISAEAAIRLTLRIILGDNNPFRYRRNPHQDGVSAISTTPNLDQFGSSPKWSDEELSVYLDLSNDYINSTWGQTRSFITTEHPNRLLLMRGAEILAIRAKGYTELNEHFELSDGGASLVLNRYPQWHTQADTLETGWKEDVKMWKYKFRPKPVGIATSFATFGLQGIFSDLGSYVSVYGNFLRV